MFALEIDFHDGLNDPEVFLVRRTQALVGNDNSSHVILDSLPEEPFSFKIVRGLGRDFQFRWVRKPNLANVTPSSDFSSYGKVNLDSLEIGIIPLDIDVRVLEEAFSERAAMRILSRALERSSPRFPAVAVIGPDNRFVSFAEDEALVIGRSRLCGLRLDSVEISSEHARIGFKDGHFWVEDLGSTNGTYVSGRKISGRRMLERGGRVRIGASFSVLGIANEEDLTSLEDWSEERIVQPELTQDYPRVLSTSDLVRPRQFTLASGTSISVGRDPVNDIWIGSPHVSRKHFELNYQAGNSLVIIDHSSNGTYLGGQRLPSGQPLELEYRHHKIDLGDDLQIHICFSEQDEMAVLSPDLLPAGQEEQAGAEFQDYIVPTSMNPAVKDSSADGVFGALAQRADNRIHSEADGIEIVESSDPSGLDREVEYSMVGRYRRSILQATIVFFVLFIVFGFILLVGGF